MTTVVKRYRFVGLSNENKNQLIREMFESEGYKVLDTHLLKVSEKVNLISPEGNKWSVSPDTFKKGVRCPLDSNMSWGERCVASVLKQNSIHFETQRTIFHKDGTRQYMDFYVKYNGNKYCIEYNGRQHYETDTNRLFAPVEKQKEADQKKKSYCMNNEIIYVEIPYIFNDVQDVAIELHKYISIIDLSKGYKVETFNNEKEVVKYYMKHSEKKTAEKFGISGSTVRKMAYRHGHKKKGNYNEENVLDYYKNHTAQETADNFGLTLFTVTNMARKLGSLKVKHYNHCDVISYYMNHTLKETTAKFGISRQGITKIMNKYGVQKSRRKG